MRIDNLPLILCTDSKSLFECLVKLGTTQEKRLMIDILSLLQSYKRREISEVVWIDGDCNPADTMTKTHPCQALRDLSTATKLTLRPRDGWREEERNRKGKGQKRGLRLNTIDRNNHREKERVPSV